MRLDLILLSILLNASMAYSQNASDDQFGFPEYKWLNKQIPLDTLVSYDGDTLVLFSSNKHYVISFWYTNCPPCIAEINWLNKLQLDYAHYNIEFIAISFDDKEDIDDFLIRQPFEFQLCHLNQNTINQNMLAIGYPTNLIVDKNGIVKFQKSGGPSDPNKANEIYNLLSEELEKIID